MFIPVPRVSHTLKIENYRFRYGIFGVDYAKESTIERIEKGKTERMTTIFGFVVLSKIRSQKSLWS